MNTIPTTLESGAAPYTVVGAPKPAPSGEAGSTTVVLLNRGSRLYRNESIDELARAGLGSVLSVEDKGEGLDAESLAARHPGTRFLILSEPTSVGARLNLAIRESPGPYVLVLWNDMSLSAQSLSSRFFDRLAERDLLCSAPSLYGRGGEQLPTAIAPAQSRSSLKLLQLLPESDGERSLYPFDYAGIYSREKFMLTGGFDAGIASPYWQKIDFGFRAWLWGEEIRIAQALKLSYAEAPGPEDETPDEGYKRFWLKNLAPSFRGDSGAIGFSRFWAYLRSRGGGAASALGEFKAAREWVRLNRYRFRTDAASLVDLWDEGRP
jgi:hypothetical protein